MEAEYEKATAICCSWEHCAQLNEMDLRCGVLTAPSAKSIFMCSCEIFGESRFFNETRIDEGAKLLLRKSILTKIDRKTVVTTTSSMAANIPVHRNEN